MGIEVVGIFGLLIIIADASGQLPLGWDREKSNRSFGLRTFPLVAVVTCGFIGGGAILTNSDKVKGTVTAATI